IGPEHAEALRQLALPGLHAIDVNSKFETRPGLKDSEKLKSFRDQVMASV
ncbi:MAG: phosphoribosylanthranilate isomerase, partial [Bacteroidetes bacterium]